MKKEASLQTLWTFRKRRKYYEQLYAHRVDNTDEMHHILDRHNLPKLTQEEIDNQSRPMLINEIKSKVNNLPKLRALVTDGFTGEFYKIFQEEMIPIFCNVSKKIKAKGILLTQSEASITLNQTQRHFKKTTEEYLSLT